MVQLFTSPADNLCPVKTCYARKGEPKWFTEKVRKAFERKHNLYKEVAHIVVNKKIGAYSSTLKRGLLSC